MPVLIIYTTEFTLLFNVDESSNSDSSTLKLLASVNPSETRHDNESSSHRFLMPLSLSSFSQSSPIVLRTRIPFILRRHESRRDSSNLSAQNLSCILPPFSILSLVSNEHRIFVENWYLSFLFKIIHKCLATI